MTEWLSTAQQGIDARKLKNKQNNHTHTCARIRIHTQAQTPRHFIIKLLKF